MEKHRIELSDNGSYICIDNIFSGDLLAKHKHNYKRCFQSENFKSF